MPPDLQAEVYRTVKIRGPYIDRTWAPWWRAQGAAIAHVGFLVEPNAAARGHYLARVEEFALQLETKV